MECFREEECHDENVQVVPYEMIEGESKLGVILRTHDCPKLLNDVVVSVGIDTNIEDYLEGLKDIVETKIEDENERIGMIDLVKYDIKGDVAEDNLEGYQNKDEKIERPLLNMPK